MTSISRDTRNIVGSFPMIYVNCHHVHLVLYFPWRLCVSLGFLFLANCYCYTKMEGAPWGAQKPTLKPQIEKANPKLSKCKRKHRCCVHHREAFRRPYSSTTFVYVFDILRGRLIGKYAFRYEEH